MHMHRNSRAGPCACACTTLRKPAPAVARVYDDALAEAGMTTAQFAILRHIAREQPVPLSRLADSLVMDRTSLYRALAPSAGKGWGEIAHGAAGPAAGGAGPQPWPRALTSLARGAL